MTRSRAALLLLLATSGCGAKRALTPSRPEPPPTAPPPLVREEPSDDDRLDPADARRRVEATLAKVARARRLPATSEVASHVLGREALIARVRRHVETEVPRDVIRGQGEALVALGLLPPTYDYEAGIFRLLEAQLAGYYEPSDKAMYLASDLGERAADATLAHELVHALQDQHYDLGKKLAYRAEANDQQSATQALAEGDATSAMMDVMVEGSGRRAVDVPDRVFAVEVEASIAIAPDSGIVPRVLRSSLVAPYVDGVSFVHALRRRGDWAAVDAAWRSPPESTEQLLHLEKYDAREKPEVIAAVPPPDPQGWSVVYDDVFGEQGLRLALAEWMPAQVAVSAAAGWGGDRATLFAKGSGPSASLALAWHVRFDRAPGKDPDAEAREAFRALAGRVHAADAASSGCLERPDLGPWSVLRAGRDLVIATGPYRREAGRAVAEGDCKHSTRWAADVVGAGAPARH